MCSRVGLLNQLEDMYQDSLRSEEFHQLQTRVARRRQAKLSWLKFKYEIALVTEQEVLEELKTLPLPQ